MKTKRSNKRRSNTAPTSPRPPSLICVCLIALCQRARDSLFHILSLAQSPSLFRAANNVLVSLVPSRRSHRSTTTLALSLAHPHITVTHNVKKKTNEREREERNATTQTDRHTQNRAHSQSLDLSARALCESISEIRPNLEHPSLNARPPSTHSTMDNTYGIGVTNRYELFCLDDDTSDATGAVIARKAKQQKKAAAKQAEKENKATAAAAAAIQAQIEAAAAAKAALEQAKRGGGGGAARRPIRDSQNIRGSSGNGNAGNGNGEQRTGGPREGQFISLSGALPPRTLPRSLYFLGLDYVDVIFAPRIQTLSIDLQ